MTVTLTRRELQVAQLVAMDMTYSEVADVLGIAHETVQTHVTNLAAKLPGDRRPSHKIRAFYFQHLAAPDQT